MVEYFQGKVIDVLYRFHGDGDLLPLPEGFRSLRKGSTGSS